MTERPEVPTSTKKNLERLKTSQVFENDSEKYSENLRISRKVQKNFSWESRKIAKRSLRIPKATSKVPK